MNDKKGLEQGNSEKVLKEKISSNVENGVIYSSSGFILLLKA